MEVFEMPVQVRWADLDPNFHLRHSVFYDWGALCRIEYLSKKELTWQRMAQLQIGPIIFREECIFKREIRLGDPVTIGMKLVKARRDFSRFTIEHIIKKDPATVSAILTVDIAWINGVTRKLAVLPAEDAEKLSSGLASDNFSWLD
ncbi:MAG: acyl-CoA thioesterase [Chitinophagaceae bacterium]